MQMLKNKTMAIVIALILASSIAISIGALSTVKGDAYHTYPIPGTITTTKPYGDGYDCQLTMQCSKACTGSVWMLTLQLQGFFCGTDSMTAYLHIATS